MKGVTRRCWSSLLNTCESTPMAEGRKGLMRGAGRITATAVKL